MPEPVINFRGMTPVSGANLKSEEARQWTAPFTGLAYITVNQAQVSISGAPYTVTASSPNSESISFMATAGRTYTIKIFANYNLGGTSLQLKPAIPTAVPKEPLGQPITIGPSGTTAGMRAVRMNPGWYYLAQTGPNSDGLISFSFYQDAGNNVFDHAIAVTNWTTTLFGNGRMFASQYDVKLGSSYASGNNPEAAKLTTS